MIKAVLFDKDGTLIDFNATFAPATLAVINDLADGDLDAAEKMAADAGFDLKTLGIARDSVLIAGSLENIADCWQPHVPETDGATFLAELDRLYIKHSLVSLTPFPSLEPTLNTLAGTGLKLGIATNDSEAAAKSHMMQLGVDGFFDFIAGFDSGFGEKPGPGMITAYSRFCRVKPAQIAMVGDSIHDCHAGRAAGACVVAVTSGPAGFAELQPHADHVIDDLNQLPSLIHMLNASEGVMS